MERNVLHPERIVRRLRNRSAQILRQDLCSDVAGIARRLRFDAEMAESNAQFWEKATTDYADPHSMEHIICHYRRAARRLRDTADAIERDHAAGPWVSLEQPFVHLNEAAPAGQPEEVAH